MARKSGISYIIGKSILQETSKKRNGKKRIFSLKSEVSEVGTFLLNEGHLVKSRDVFGCHNLGVGDRSRWVIQGSPTSRI